MISVDGFYENGEFRYLRINGHADPLICSAVSAIITGCCNAFLNPERFQISLKSGNSYIIRNTKEPISQFDCIVLDTVLAQLATIANQYTDELQFHVNCKKGQ